MIRSVGKNMNKLRTLFLTFLKIGAFTFGGGYAMIALLENEFVSKKKWVDKNEFLDMVAVAESTPGPIAINAATYIGYKLSGMSGAILSTIGVSLPSFIIMFLISLFLDKFLALKLVGFAFRGIQACVIYMILFAGIKMLGQLEKKAFNYVIFGAVVISMVAFSILAVNFSAVFFILICGFIGIAYYYIKRIGDKK
jgi:chromate transporter